MKRSAVLMVLVVGVASAETQAEVAAKLDSEGIQLMYAAKYGEATVKFQQAVARVPEPKYFFNLCVSLFQEGRFGEALTACEGASRNQPPKELAAKIDAMTQKIKDEAKSQGVTLSPGGGGKSAPASGGTQAEIAAKLVEEGKKLMYASKFAEASAKFRDAIARVPEAKYFFNLCVSLFQEGRLAESLTACEGASRNQPPKDLVAKIDAMVQKIKDEAKLQNVNLGPGAAAGGKPAAPASGAQADIAAKLVEEGKALMYASKFGDASAKFRQAVARVPDPRYFFNLCMSLFQEGKFGEALVACDGASRNQPAKELVQKIDGLVQKIRDEAKKQGVALPPPPKP